MSHKKMSFQKTPWRRQNIHWISGYRKFLCELEGKNKGHLKYAYVDLFGDSGHEMHTELVDAKYLPKGFTNHYIGLDNEPEHLLGYVLRTGKKPQFRLCFGDAFSNLPDMMRKNAPPIGIVGLDMTNGINSKWWENHTDSLRNIVELGTQGPHRFLLLLNHVLDLGGEANLDAMGRIDLHTKHLLQTFAPWDLQKQDLVTGVELAREPGFKGFAGGFEIYRSDDKTLRMVTVRLAFDGRSKRTTVYRGPLLSQVAA